MIGNYGPCLKFTLRHEGGFADDPRDPGGRTMQGVTQRAFDAWRRAQNRPTGDVRGLQPVERDSFYRDRYWAAVGGDHLPAGVDLALFDFAVNSGAARALRAHDASAEPDMVEAVKRICARRLSFLRALRTFGVFGRGWVARVAACEALGVRMAEQSRIGRAPDGVPEPQVVGRLRAEARSAVGQARRHGQAASATALGGAAGVPATTTASLPLAVVTALLATAVIAAAFLAFSAFRARQRALAYATLAG